VAFDFNPDSAVRFTLWVHLLRVSNDEVAIFVELAEDMSGFKRGRVSFCHIYEGSPGVAGGRANSSRLKRFCRSCVQFRFLHGQHEGSPH
jgi:hypothetical protein